MELPPSQFQDLENVTLLLMTKANRQGDELLSYSLGDPDETVVYNIDEEQYRLSRMSGIIIFLVSVSYKGAKVMRIEKTSRYMQMGVFTDAGDLLGRISKNIMDYIVEDEDREKLFRISCPASNTGLFASIPMYVVRVADQEPLAYIGRRFMMEPLENTRTTHIQRWCVRYLLTPLSLKEKVLILAAVLIVDYIEPAVHIIAGGDVRHCVCM